MSGPTNAACQAFFPYTPISIYEYTSFFSPSPWSCTLWFDSAICRMSCCLISHLAPLRTASWGSPSSVFNVKFPTLWRVYFSFLASANHDLNYLRAKRSELCPAKVLPTGRVAWQIAKSMSFLRVWERGRGEVWGSRFYYRTGAVEINQRRTLKFQ